jgi:outer membrane lipoprotein-sorting protein
MRLLFSAAVLALVATRSAQAQPNEAEKLYRAMEKNIRAAKSLKIAGEIEVNFKQDGGTLKGTLLVAEGNKLRVELAGKSGDKDISTSTISNGKTTVSETKPGGKASWDTDTSLTDIALALSARLGLFAFIGISKRPDDKAFDLDKVFPVSDFQMGGKEMVGKRQAVVLSYNVVAAGKGKAKVTVWLDPKTNLPIKRKLEPLNDAEKGQGFVDTYTEFELNPTIEAKRFDLPK